jgi:mercuric ion transport protein
MTRRWKESALAGPAVGASLLPTVICPMCSPTYAAVLSSIGLGFRLSTAYLIPVTLVFLLLAVGALAFRASTRWGHGPFWVGLVAAGSILAGKFSLDSSAVTYGGVGALVLASVWNAVARRRATNICPACLPGQTHAQ